jgi:hypothetical protein
VCAGGVPDGAIVAGEPVDGERRGTCVAAGAAAGTELIVPSGPQCERCRGCPSSVGPAEH